MMNTQRLNLPFTWLRLLLTALLIATIVPSAGLVASPRSASSASPSILFEVNITFDGADLNPGDTKCDASPDPDDQCTLRAAIMETNALSGEHEIELPAGTYTLIGGADEDDSETGDLDIKGEITITGAGAETTVIDGGGTDRVFHLFSGFSATLKGLTVRNGSVVALSDCGGGIFSDSGTLSLENSQVISNTATNCGGGIYASGSGATSIISGSLISGNNAGYGAGIHNVGNLTLNNTTISGNKITEGWYDGGGIYNSGQIQATHSTISDNGSLRYGGGIYSYTGSIILEDSTVSDNSADLFGGGIFDEKGSLSVTSSTVNGNTAVHGGGVFVYGSSLELTNSTLSGNRATDSGGGLYIDDHTDDKTIRLSSATITRNRANLNSQDDSGDDNGGGIYVESGFGGTVYFKNTILADNHRGVFFLQQDDDCKGNIHSMDYNLVEEIDGCNISGTTTNNKTGDAMLDGLVDNGGPTLTHFPQIGSPVIDSGNPNGCKDQSDANLAIDQRGYSRTVDGDGDNSDRCDIGAVEYAINPVPTLTSLSPSSTSAGGAAFTLTLTGSDFVNGAVAQWDGVDRTTTFISSTQLSGQISAADIATQGLASVTVVNPSPGGGASNALSFTITAPPNPIPVLTSLSPSSAQAGGGAFTLTVTGSNFASGAVVAWNGANRTTTFVSTNQVTAQIAAADIASAGSASVTVTNPTPGGGASNALAFTITAAPTSNPTLYLPLVMQ